MNRIASVDLIILFFLLGYFASWIKSDLEIPEQISKFISIFLLLSLGLRGGHEVRFADSLEGFLPSLLIGVFSCVSIPIILFYALQNRLGVRNVAALAAAFGSVSAITFIAAQGVLENRGFALNGYMVAVMALMEIPAIIIAIYLYRNSERKSAAAGTSILKSILSTKSVVLLVGGFIIGYLMNKNSWSGISPVVQGCFKGILGFFLLDLGFVAQRQIKEALKFKKTALVVAFICPLFFGACTLVLSHFLGVRGGDSILLAVLVGSASYIAAPAAMRASIPEANPSLYLALPLAFTFPMNLLFGIPFYINLSNWLSGF